ncbi:tumor necrosis factor receptor superfamily member 21 isoform X1, partial [Tachysurus ichikawai]
DLSCSTAAALYRAEEQQAHTLHRSLKWPHPQLFYTLVNDVLVQALTSSPGTEGSISPRQYRHTDPDTGTQFVCDKCPAGTYVTSHCTNSSMRECMECPEGTFTRGENGVQQCHRCRSRCLPPFVEKSPCTATSDRVCVCPPGIYAKAGECSPLPECLPGWGVRKLDDVRCRRCPRGTFSSVPSRALRCQTHTDCQVLGMLLLTKGTDKTDNVCGPSAPGPISTSSHSLDPAPGGKNEKHCQAHVNMRICEVIFNKNAHTSDEYTSVTPLGHYPIGQ